jgi:hypothetical protein
MTYRGQLRPPSLLTNFHYDIHGTKLTTHPTEDFPDGALHQRTRDRAWCDLPADHNPQSGLFTRSTISAQNDEKVTLPLRRKRTGKLRLAAQPRFPRQPQARRL